MKRVFLAAAILFTTILPYTGIAQSPAQAAADPDTSPTPSVLCLPGVYLDNPGDCTPTGPSDYLTRMAQQGVTFPVTPLAFGRPDPALTNVDIKYGLVRNANAPVYSSVEEAMNGKRSEASRRIDSPFSYISYTEEEQVGGRRFYMIDPNAWMTANDVSRLGAVPLFQGITFTETPLHQFGWVLQYLGPDLVQTQRTPGYKNQD
jgi:hypothetical protein